MASRTIFLVDGFNVYHSAVDIQRDHGQKVKWLDYNALFKSYLHLFGKDAILEQVYWFTALADHLGKPDTIRRHRDYMRALEATGVQRIEGRFKPRTMWCPNCGKDHQRHEEKETDVAIATKLFEVCVTNQCDRAILVTGDTDLAPAVKTAQSLFQNIEIAFAFPYKRSHKELTVVAPKSFKISKKSYVRHQLSDPVQTLDGTTIAKPVTW